MAMQQQVHLMMNEDPDEVTPTEPIKKPCNFAQALIYMEELKLYASCSQGPGSDEMYTEMLKLQAAMIRVLPKQRQSTIEEFFTSTQPTQDH